MLWLLLGLLSLELSSLLLLDLLHGLKEELLDIAPLVKDHLTDSFQIGAFRALHPDGLSQVFQLLMLLSDDLLVLKLQELSLLFKVSYDLCQTLLKKLDLRLKKLDLLVLLKLLLSMLLYGLTFLSQVLDGLFIVQL